MAPWQELRAANARVDRDVADVVGDVGRARWWGLGFGVLSVIAGVIALAWPDATVVVLATVFGVQLFVLGIFRVVAAFALSDTSAASRVLSVVLGVLSFIVGILCLRSPLQTVVVVTLVLGAFWLIHGVVDIVIGISGRGEHGRGWTIAGGVIGVLAGIVVLSSRSTAAGWPGPRIRKVEALAAQRPDPSLRDGVGPRCAVRVRMMRMSAPANTASKAAVNLPSRSRHQV